MLLAVAFQNSIRAAGTELRFPVLHKPVELKENLCSARSMGIMTQSRLVLVLSNRGQWCHLHTTQFMAVIIPSTHTVLYNFKVPYAH